MAVNVEIPELGESVTEAILVEWLKQDGDRVELDESVCVIETDKADAELPAPAAGVVTRITKEGDTVLVGEAVATIDDSADGQAAAPAAEKKLKHQSERLRAPTRLRRSRPWRAGSVQPCVVWLPRTI